MSSNETTYLVNSFLNHISGVAIYTPPTSLWLGLMSDYPSQSYFPELPLSNNYNRANIIFATASNKIIVNSNTVTFPHPTVSWGMVLGYGIWDSQTNGNCLYILNSSPTFEANKVIVFTPGSVQLGDIY